NYPRPAVIRVLEVVPTAGRRPRSTLVGQRACGGCTMPALLRPDVPYPGPARARMSAAFRHMAANISFEPALPWKIWIEGREMGEAGGIYLFDTLDAAEMYLEKHRERLAAEGFVKINAKLFEVNEALSLLTRAPL